ncbi:MAG: hypothetical protein COC19_02960 [SAR86 cluster bacterium]|uniref:Uncharacterized protein n=1 Tax=SAR86 cluster bacterium TaxID=2030880 RepID=A0A2A4MRR2_9GAMM|nr:MAG: hypothetical protein COC19_02960 [SAR86 cluster bacterium]
MAKLIYESEIIDPKPGKRWVVLHQDIQDVQRHLNDGNNRPRNWEGFSWALLGGGFSFSISIISYHLFEQTPDKNVLVLGYGASISFILTSCLLIFRNNSEPPSYEFHKKEAVRILNRVSAENQTIKFQEIKTHKVEENFEDQLEGNLKIDFRENSTNLFKE